MSKKQINTVLSTASSPQGNLGTAQYPTVHWKSIYRDWQDFDGKCTSENRRLTLVASLPATVPTQHNLCTLVACPSALNLVSVLAGV